MTKNLIILFLRNELRIHDNPLLYYSLRDPAATHVLPVYCFDPRQIDISRVPTALTANKQFEPPKTHYFKFDKCGPHRTRFTLEALQDLQKNLRDHGSNLLLQFGHPEEVIPQLVDKLLKKDYKVLGVYAGKENMYEETLVETRMKRNLSVPIRFFWHSTLYDPNTLPFDPKDTPDVFTQFRKQVEAVRHEIREPLVIPKPFNKPFPSGSDLVADDNEMDPKTNVETILKYFNISQPIAHSAFPFKGGETSGLARVKDYFWETKNISSYKKTRNGLVGADYSSKFSPWLANGTLSPRYIHSELLKYEETHGSNESTYWLYFELLWRDCFRFLGSKHGNAMFYLEGMLGHSGSYGDGVGSYSRRQATRKQQRGIQQPSPVPKRWKESLPLFNLWKNGKTGIPFVDANMRELNETGFMSNRGRQNVASFHSHSLSLNWLMGAEYFESMLLDYDPCANYGNWQYTSGVGTDPRENRQFNMIKQAKDYDPDGEFVKLWVPELLKLDISVDSIHSPWTLGEEKMKEIGYLMPVIVEKQWEKHIGRKAGDGSKRNVGNPSESVEKNRFGGSGGKRNNNVGNPRSARSARSQKGGNRVQSGYMQQD